MIGIAARKKKISVWLFYACGSAVFAGLTAILAKCGIRKVNSNLATALRTGVVLIFAWLIVFITGAQSGLGTINMKSLLFLILSGLSTGVSWLCYFRALQLGDIDRVTPVDKSSTVLTILLAFILLREPVDLWKGAGILLIGTGTFLMIRRKKSPSEEKIAGRGWLFYAMLSALFASLTSILGKIGVQGVDSNLATAIRTGVVLVMAWIVVCITGEQKGLPQIDGKSWLFLILSGAATGGSWLCYYRALQDGPASVVVPVDKLSILLTVAFSQVFLGERLDRRGAIGLGLIVVGTLALLV